ncbi:MAG: hypothetical protein ABIL66_10820 [candidate division WOR-3 bacterium]
MKFKHHFCILLLLLIYCSLTGGQVLSPVLKKGEFEAGYTQKWFHRKMQPDYVTGIDWYAGTVFIRYGVARRFTFTAEGIVSPYVQEKVSGCDCRIYALGSGFACHIWQFDASQIAVLFHYIEYFWFDQSALQYHFNIRGVVGSIQFGHPFLFANQKIIGWVAPTYIYDESIRIRYPYGPGLVLKDKSFNNLGFSVGCNMVLLRQFAVFVHLVYADFLQPRLGIGYKF